MNVDLQLSDWSIENIATCLPNTVTVSLDGDENPHRSQFR